MLVASEHGVLKIGGRTRGTPKIGANMAKRKKLLWKVK